MSATTTCNLKHVKSTAENCEPTLSGIVDRVYLFLMDEWKAARKTASKTGLPKPTNGKYAATDLAELEGLLYAVDVAESTGKVTSSRPEGKKTVSTTLTYRVEDNLLDYNEVCHTIGARNFGVLAHQPGLGWHVIFSPYGNRTKLANETDSGDVWDSDHGTTSTITCAPVAYDLSVLPESETFDAESFLHTDSVSG